MKKIFTLSLLICFTLKVFSQQPNIQKELNKEGSISFLKFHSSNN